VITICSDCPTACDEINPARDGAPRPRRWEEISRLGLSLPWQGHPNSLTINDFQARSASLPRRTLLPVHVVSVIASVPRRKDTIARWVNSTVMSPLLERATISAAPSVLPQRRRTKRHCPGATLRFPQGFFSSIKHSRRAREMTGRSCIPPKTSGRAWRKGRAAQQLPFCPHAIPVAYAGSAAGELVSAQPSGEGCG